ncbi:MAG TPA: PQQ-dependent sugar dehydrogenase [Caldimonas sp.]|nr:PQQ-dependent sugar dehydrogenase [Caldimonas sp.]
MGRRILALLCAAACAVTAHASSVPLERLRVPAGFRVELLTDAVPNARAMALGRMQGAKGVLYVGSMGAGKVYAVELDGGRAGRVHVVASGLELPAGVAWREGALYVSAVSRILRFDGIDARLADPPPPVVINDRLPSETHHGAKFLSFGPDGKLYVPTGAPCNVCIPDTRHGILQRMNADGSGLETIASGIRNTVGFDWSPVDRSLWFTDNGRDMMGDDMPSDELNRLAHVGDNFGYPYCHQGDTPDPEFGARRPCSEFVPPAAKLGAHVAALGMRFYTGSQFPEGYRGNAFIAEHGSWNRSRKVGYRVVRVAIDAQGRVTAQEPFLEGFLQVDANGRETVFGRPADVLVMPDGALLVSDDLSGAIYRVVWQGSGR